ncbi:MAG: hypothetical protein PHO14_02670 [Kiritimatiellae bacterium]|nr:hypothetical protein [Kiritimatiellia bacterium]MDD4341118.1 hypothetical protein [Kiritimatiellia bacterium]MDY0148920.1 hypothetical protein [Kiritimatiellia bacterium]
MKPAAQVKTGAANDHAPLNLQAWVAAPHTGQVLSFAFGLLFLFQCTILPLVGKAAMGGSGSPGAEPAVWAGKNQAFFLVMLLVTLATGAAAFYSKGCRRRLEGTPFPWVTAGVLALTLALLIAFLVGLLKI